MRRATIGGGAPAHVHPRRLRAPPRAPPTHTHLPPSLPTLPLAHPAGTLATFAASTEAPTLQNCAPPRVSLPFSFAPFQFTPFSFDYPLPAPVPLPLPLVRVRRQPPPTAPAALSFASSPPTCSHTTPSTHTRALFRPPSLDTHAHTPSPSAQAAPRVMGLPLPRAHPRRLPMRPAQPPDCGVQVRCGGHGRACVGVGMGVLCGPPHSPPAPSLTSPRSLTPLLPLPPPQGGHARSRVAGRDGRGCVPGAGSPGHGPRGARAAAAAAARAPGCAGAWGGGGGRGGGGRTVRQGGCWGEHVNNMRAHARWLPAPAPPAHQTTPTHNHAAGRQGGGQRARGACPCAGSSHACHQGSKAG